MILSKKDIKENSHYFSFHQEEHEKLFLAVLLKVIDKLDFKLKIQKASIQLLNPDPFIVFGFRRNKKNIFLEFYHEESIKEARIIKSIKVQNSLYIHRVEISDEKDINKELLEYMVHSNALVNR